MNEGKLKSEAEMAEQVPSKRLLYRGAPAPRSDAFDFD
jgi:hypothetical protein